MKTRVSRLGMIAAGLFAALLTGCGEEPVPPSAPPKPAVDAEKAAEEAHNKLMEKHVYETQPRIMARIARAKADLAKAEAEGRPAAELAMLTNRVQAAFAELENDRIQAQREVRARIARENAAAKTLTEQQKGK